MADTCNNQGRKGRGVRVVGRLKEDRWTGNDGKLRSRVSIVAEHVEFRPEFKKETVAENGKNSAYGDSLADEAADPIEAAEEQGYDDTALMTEYEEPSVLAETVF